jgi:phage major head subunit gpT-like protein
VIVTPANIERFFTTLDTSYRLQYGLTESWQEKLCTQFPCNSEAWMNAWLDFLDKFRVWKGSRVVRFPTTLTYLVSILPWELTYELDQFKFEDDSYGIYAPLGPYLGEQAKKIKDYAVKDLLQGAGDFAGGPQISLDGVTHWNSAHPVDFWDAAKGTYPNDYGTAGVSVNGVTVGGSFSVTAYKTLKEDAQTRKNASGEVDGQSMPDLTMVPSQLETEAKVVLQSTFFAPATIGVLTSQVGAFDNALKGSTDLFMNLDISNEAATWYMFKSKGVIKPLGMINRKEIAIIPRMRPDDPIVFDRHALQWGASGRFTPAWGPPRFASRSGIVA